MLMDIWLYICQSVANENTGSVQRKHPIPTRQLSCNQSSVYLTLHHDLVWIKDTDSRLVNVSVYLQNGTASLE